jgi:predicted HTH transcriptional regulator
MSDHPLTERRIVPDARFEDLDLDLVRRHIRTAVERRGYEGTTEPIEYLQRYHCLVRDEGGLRPTIVGMLAFAAEPDRWLDTAGIDIAQFSGPGAHSTALVFSRQIRGPIVDVINRTVDLLWARTEHRIRLEGAERVEESAYNITVLRELTVNTLCHRDWALAGSIARIEIHPEFIRWITPGGLPPGVTVENIRVAQVSRNPGLAQMLYHGGMVEKFGLGIDTVLDILASLGCDPPIYHDDTNFFTFQVWGRSMGLARQAEEPPGLTLRQERILAELRSRRVATSAEIAGAIGAARRNVQRDLNVLLKHGLVHMDGPSSRARYRALR